MAVCYIEILRLTEGKVQGKVQVKSYIWYPGPDSNVKNRCPDINGKTKASDQAVDLFLTEPLSCPHQCARTAATKVQPQPGRLKQQSCVFSQLKRLQVRDGGVGRVGSFQGL